jgi:hypothetical protein
MRRAAQHDDDRVNQMTAEMSPLSSSPLGGFELPQSAFSLDGDDDALTNYQLSSNENALGLFINDDSYRPADAYRRK